MSSIAVRVGAGSAVGASEGDTTTTSTVITPADTVATQAEVGQPVGLLFERSPELVAARVGGELWDLDRLIPSDLAEDTLIEAVFIGSDDGRYIMRHSAAHVLAQAVQDLFPEAKLGIGPPIENGFYYDFDVPEPFTPEDLTRIEKRMREIIKANQRFARRDISDDAARTELAQEPYKLELIDLKGGASQQVDTSEVMEVGAGGLTMYDNIDRHGELAWTDLCRGPHVPTTRRIPAFKLMRSAAAYWRGQEGNPQLQRIYGTAWESKEALTDYLTFLEEAAKRDHRKLGTELDLFSFPDEVGSGLAVFHPNGGIIRMEMEEYSRRRHVEAGYSFVNTPHITKAQLFETSKHLEWYEDAMYPPMHLDTEYHADGTVRKPGQDYYLKPMNCPMHNLVFSSRGRSYRELPLRLFEFGMVYRYEKSGVVHGMTRARGFTQDDAHIYCTLDQMRDELASLLDFVLNLLRDYGLDDFYLELSTRDPEKSVGDDKTWEEATQTLYEVATSSGLELVDDPGGAAFYGPKISVQARDAIGRTWQLSTIQLDFFEPELFDLEYTAADGSRQRPVMIHRALFGSIERFFAILTEHYAGAFPPWLAPVQVTAIPIAEAHIPYLEELAQQLRQAGVRVQVDTSSDRMQKKIRNATQQKVPFILLAGDQDIAANAVSFRYRDGRQDNGVPLAEAVERITGAIADRVQV